MTGKVYIANCGEGNALWPVAKANSTLITVDNYSVHPYWQKGDRAGFIETAQRVTWNALGERPSRQTAGRWFNLVNEMRDTVDDIWITRQGDDLWWTVSLSGALRETLAPSINTKRDGPEIWRIEKPCEPWSNRDRQGRALRWKALHAKACDFLATEATFQSIAEDRGYADYARALVNGDSLEPWHSLPLFKNKAVTAKRQGVRIFTAKERAAEEMAKTILKTVGQSNGQQVERTVKGKLTEMSQQELEEFLCLRIDEQQGLCALTGLPLGFPSECEDKQMLASADRIDSDGHYTEENIQIVCRFINRWKGADDNDQTLRLIAALQSMQPRPVP